MTDAVQKKKFWFKAGIIGSLAGELILAIPMGMMGAFPGIASMMGCQSAAVGFIIHMMISLIFGIAFALFAGMVKLHPAVTGLIFGVIIWIIGPMILMPMMMGSSGGACGTASKAACGTVAKSSADAKAACGTAAKSSSDAKAACGTAAKTSSDAKAACGTAAKTASANPCGGGSGSMSMWLSLATHLMYGLITGVTYKLVKGKAA